MPAPQADGFACRSGCVGLLPQAALEVEGSPLIFKVLGCGLTLPQAHARGKSQAG
jgi:hypothetical protein